EPQKVLPVLQDAIERQKRILSQSLSQTEERIRQLATQLQVNPDLLMAGEIPHPENQDMNLLELEGEMEISRHLREQIESLEHLTLCL
ncbi:MAG: hypothetical protein WA974_19180, partial [Thermodesulfobacteriota bacterium]